MDAAVASEISRYHNSQWIEPYRSTVAVEAFAKEWLDRSREVVDLGCGAGAPTFYLASKHPQTRFIGIDNSKELLAIARKLSEQNGAQNLEFKYDDMIALEYRNHLDGVMCLQTINWIKDMKGPLDQLCGKLNPSWIVFSGLFYPGDISCNIEVSEHGGRQTYYHTFGVLRMERELRQRGYKLARFAPFEIDIDLPRPADTNLMRTYTERTHDGRRLQISGPLLMNWGFLAFEKL